MLEVSLLFTWVFYIDVRARGRPFILPSNIIIIIAITCTTLNLLGKQFRLQPPKNLCHWFTTYKFTFHLMLYFFLFIYAFRHTTHSCKFLNLKSVVHISPILGYTFPWKVFVESNKLFRLLIQYTFVSWCRAYILNWRYWYS